MLAGDIEVKAGLLIIGDGRLLEDAYVSVSKGVTKEILEEKLKGKYGEITDLSDRYVIPGLVDAHVHIRYGPKPDTEAPTDEYQTA